MKSSRKDFVPEGFNEALDLKFPLHIVMVFNSLSVVIALVRHQQGGMWSPKGLAQEEKGREKGGAWQGRLTVKWDVQ